ncbi:MAG: hypothetical protein COX19_16635 [Desulfobacterales bacterium CG23_combo_of_CG06-09_8_20_14_all_51_8]|nr:MAG: hypothetical protein COX19_16635 [Desulfobacterales bacterium CG23_combo_of_CG06-09_8_20_14_all_51_8]
MLNRFFLKLLEKQNAPFLYVDCGARNEFNNLLVEMLPTAKYIGFEPDRQECDRLVRLAKQGYSYYPVALGKSAEKRSLYITSNSACSSLLQPNNEFWDQFLYCAEQIKIEAIQEIQTVPLDSFLPGIKIHHIDFLELDTQGTELEILQGAESFLSSTVLGIKVEVEFSYMYQNQPLFSDIDPYLRQFDFMLFDLSRHRYRRVNYPNECETRGQLLYGQAFYLKDYHVIKADKKDAFYKLIFIADFYGFHDYALEVVNFLLSGDAGRLDHFESDMLEQIRNIYTCESVPDKKTKVLRLLHNSPLRKILHKLMSVCKTIVYRYYQLTEKNRYSWSD